ncbi:hypothetical protein [Nannocystis pusilla]|uniref:hypothetical protein n=1 Tax=Nannocystis pusilla TaxID=889268 RepID=UPI003B7B587C
MADTSSRIPDEQGFDSAAAAVRSEPERADRWDQVEALGEPERAAAIAALYREILAKELTPPRPPSSVSAPWRSSRSGSRATRRRSPRCCGACSRSSPATAGRSSG